MAITSIIKRPKKKQHKATEAEKNAAKQFRDAVTEIIKDSKTTKTVSKEEELLDPLALKVLDKFNRSKTQRSDFEERWLNSWRRFRGIYPPEVLNKMHPLRSKAFIRLTRTKVKTVDGRLDDFLLPTNGDRNWDIEPTPLPELSKEARNLIRSLVIQKTNTEPPREMLDKLMMDLANERANNMLKQIDDQLVEIHYRDIIREVLHSGHKYGTGILKGPMLNIKSKSTYSRSLEDQSWKMNTIDEFVPFAYSVSVWDTFPDMSATNVEDCDYIIERHRMPKHAVVDLIRRTDFFGDVIKQYLSEHPNGDFKDEYYDSEIRSASTTDQKNIKNEKKYQVLEFWGYMDAEDLDGYDVEIDDDLTGAAQVAVNLWVLGDKVIKACATPIAGIKWPYYFYYYDKDESSLFGEGIPEIMSDVQELINASFRGMLDNAAISAGPQIEANLNLLPEDEDPTQVYPFKVWLRSGNMADAMAPAIRVVDIPSKTNEFLRMNEAFEKYGDEVTTIPRYMWGDSPGSGAGRTSSGLSMMMGSANINIKDQVRNFDDGITTPFISALYHWNMQFSDDENIKGDFKIRATGSSSLIAKEVYANSLMQLANISASPQYASLVKPQNLIKAIVEVLDLSDKNLVKTDEEIKQETEQAAAQQQEMQAFMTNIVETAREYGVSPQDMLAQGQKLLASMQSAKAVK